MGGASSDLFAGLEGITIMACNMNCLQIIFAKYRHTDTRLCRPEDFFLQGYDMGGGELKDHYENVMARRRIATNREVAFNAAVNPWRRKRYLDMDKVMSMREHGLTYQAIANKMNCSIGLVFNRVKEKESA